MLHNDIIENAVKQSLKSNCVHKHGCVIYNRKKIFAMGFNQHVRASNTKKITLHAELSALSILKRKKIRRTNLKMLVIRIGGNSCSELKNSMPCKHCQDVIVRSRLIQSVVYS